MKIVPQSKKIEILKFAEDEEDSRRQKHGPLLPNSIRSIISGPSGNFFFFKYINFIAYLLIKKNLQVVEKPPL